MAKIQAVWAIDIGQAALKGLKLVPGETPGQVIAEAFDYVEFPKIRSQPDADPEELVNEAMATFLERNDLTGAKVAIGVSGQAGLVKFIKLPPVEKKRIPDIVKFEARQQIPFALEEVIWAYQPIGGDEKDKDDGDEGFTMAEVGLFAMKRDQIHQAIQPFKAAGIEVDVVQMAPIALYNFAAFDRLSPAPEIEEPEEEAEAEEEAEPEGDDPKSKKKAKAKAKPKPKPKAKTESRPKAKADEDQGSIVLLDIGADNTDLIITDGIRIWQRNVPIGGNHFTRALTKELKLTFAKAEHLKRNATKAPDPRAVFTAMRGVFNDFSSEVQRSIGFYSSVNRQSKITKVIGLGNGFKLPGLQKFLQQNLSYDVERLESFDRLTGEEVTVAPQFQENLMSFAVAYGLAVQGLGQGPLKTNLLPPELEQVRMIRRKKPWALVAVALLMLGFSSLFFAAWNAHAKVASEDFTKAVADAKAASQQGQQFKSAYEAAKGEFTKKLDEGKALVGEAGVQTDWPLFLKTFSQALPDPARDLKLDPNDPANARLLSMLRVHVDAILPVYRTDLGGGWYNDSASMPDFAKLSMNALDRKEAPSGEGWVIQVIGHHYNPPRLGNKMKLTPAEEAKALGPSRFVREVVLPRLWMPQFRLFGIHHAALTWMEVDPKWTTEKGASGPIMPPAPALAKAKPPAAAAPAAGAGAGGDMAAMMAAMSASAGAGANPGAGPGMDVQAMMAAMEASTNMGMMGGMMPGAATKDQDIDYLTRTNFKIEFVWQPPAPDTLPKTPEEEQKQIAEIRTKMMDAAKEQKGDWAPLDETAIAEGSKKLQKQAIDDQTQMLKAAAGAAPTPGAAPAPGVTPPTPPAGAAPAVPAPAATPK